MKRKEGKLMNNDVRLDRVNHEFSIDGVHIYLCPKEWGLLEALLENPGHVLTREKLCERVWGHDLSLDIETRTVDQHVARLRTKIAEAGFNGEIIQTVTGYGYRAGVGRIVGRDKSFDAREARAYIMDRLPQSAVEALRSAPAEAQEQLEQRLEAQVDELVRDLASELVAV